MCEFITSLIKKEAPCKVQFIYKYITVIVKIEQSSTEKEENIQNDSDFVQVKVPHVAGTELPLESFGHRKTAVFCERFLHQIAPYQNFLGRTEEKF